VGRWGPRTAEDSKRLTVGRQPLNGAQSRLGQSPAAFQAGPFDHSPIRCFWPLQLSILGLEGAPGGLSHCFAISSTALPHAGPAPGRQIRRTQRPVVSRRDAGREATDGDCRAVRLGNCMSQIIAAGARRRTRAVLSISPGVFFLLPLSGSQGPRTEKAIVFQNGRAGRRSICPEVSKPRRGVQTIGAGGGGRVTGFPSAGRLRAP